jgi:hypothetical protein
LAWRRLIQILNELSQSAVGKHSLLAFGEFTGNGNRRQASGLKDVGKSSISRNRPLSTGCSSTKGKLADRDAGSPFAVVLNGGAGPYAAISRRPVGMAVRRIRQPSR